MLDLSDSTVMSELSFSTRSPGLTRISVTSTLLKSPMSGILISIRLMTLPHSPFHDVH